MTAQIPDQFYYKDMELDLVGKKGNDLPIPDDFGVGTFSTCTACWRGYVMRYKIIENRLVLDGFWFNSNGNDDPIINGVKPIKLSKENPGSAESMHHLFRCEYSNVDKTIEFTGSLWLAKDFIDSEYVHMGFQSPTAYKTVIKFDFEKGIIVNVEDKSGEAALSREKGTCKEDHPKSISPDDLHEWIMKRFSLDIEYYKKQESGENK